jgi:hypothetical protein
MIEGSGMLSLVFFLQGNVRWVGRMGIVPLFTGLVACCQLDSLFGLNT